MCDEKVIIISNRTKKIKNFLKIMRNSRKLVINNDWSKLQHVHHQSAESRVAEATKNTEAVLWLKHVLNFLCSHVVLYIM